MNYQIDNSKHHHHFSEQCIHEVHEQCADECPVCHRMCVCPCHGHPTIEKLGRLRDLYIKQIKRAVLVDKDIKNVDL
jgi:hypothetical protein